MAKKLDIKVLEAQEKAALKALHAARAAARKAVENDAKRIRIAKRAEQRHGRADEVIKQREEAARQREINRVAAQARRKERNRFNRTRVIFNRVLNESPVEVENFMLFNQSDSRQHSNLGDGARWVSMGSEDRDFRDFRF